MPRRSCLSRTRRWFQDNPAQSLRMFDTADVTPDDSVTDIGGGASMLAESLVARGFGDVTVLDISPVALDTAKTRFGADAGRLSWFVTDLLSWRPVRACAVWHGRAVFHFLTTSDSRAGYRQTLRAATRTGSVAVVGCFALDGPKACSGLPVARYDAGGLTEEFGADWTRIAQEREEHRVPGGGIRPFTAGAAVDRMWVTMMSTRHQSVLTMARTDLETW